MDVQVGPHDVLLSMDSSTMVDELNGNVHFRKQLLLVQRQLRRQRRQNSGGDRGRDNSDMNSDVANVDGGVGENDLSGVHIDPVLVVDNADYSRILVSRFVDYVWNRLGGSFYSEISDGLWTSVEDASMAVESICRALEEVRSSSFSSMPPPPLPTPARSYRGHPHRTSAEKVMKTAAESQRPAGGLGDGSKRRTSAVHGGGLAEVRGSNRSQVVYSSYRSDGGHVPSAAPVMVVSSSQQGQHPMIRTPHPHPHYSVTVGGQQLLMLSAPPPNAAVGMTGDGVNSHGPARYTHPQLSFPGITMLQDPKFIVGARTVPATQSPLFQHPHPRFEEMVDCTDDDDDDSRDLEPRKPSARDRITTSPVSKSESERKENFGGGSVQPTCKKSQQQQIQKQTTETDCAATHPIHQRRIAKLASIGLITPDETSCPYNAEREAKWDHMLGRLLSYRDKHGNTKVPKRYKEPDGTPLGSWVNLQRKMYLRRLSGLPSQITQRRMRKLNNIGFAWFRRDAAHAAPSSSAVDDNNSSNNFADDMKATCAEIVVGSSSSTRGDDDGERGRGKGVDNVGNDLEWEDMYSRLVAYKEKHGHMYVPIGYRSEDGARLGEWLRDQKMCYSGEPPTSGLPASDNGADRNVVASVAVRDGEGSGDMLAITNTEEEVSDFEDNSRREKWDALFDRVVAFRDKFGHTRVPQHYRDEKGTPVGSWVSHQRRMYSRKMKGLPTQINERRIEKLNSIGFAWSARAMGVMSNSTPTLLSVSLRNSRDADSSSSPSKKLKPSVDGGNSNKDNIECACSGDFNKDDDDDVVASGDDFERKEERRPDVFPSRTAADVADAAATASFASSGKGNVDDGVRTDLQEKRQAMDGMFARDRTSKTPPTADDESPNQKISKTPSAADDEGRDDNGDHDETSDVDEARWDAMFYRLVACRVTMGNTSRIPHLFKDIDCNVLERWVRDQRGMYAQRAKGESSGLNQRRTNKLNKIGFAWYSEDADSNSKADANKNGVDVRDSDTEMTAHARKNATSTRLQRSGPEGEKNLDDEAAGEGKAAKPFEGDRSGNDRVGMESSQIELSTSSMQTVDEAAGEGKLSRSGNDRMGIESSQIEMRREDSSSMQANDGATGDGKAARFVEGNHSVNDGGIESTQIKLIRNDSSSMQTDFGTADESGASAATPGISHMEASRPGEPAQRHVDAESPPLSDTCGSKSLGLDVKQHNGTSETNLDIESSSVFASVEKSSNDSASCASTSSLSKLPKSGREDIVGGRKPDVGGKKPDETTVSRSREGLTSNSTPSRFKTSAKTLFPHFHRGERRLTSLERIFLREGRNSIRGTRSLSMEQEDGVVATNAAEKKEGSDKAGLAVAGPPNKRQRLSARLSQTVLDDSSSATINQHDSFHKKRNVERLNYTSRSAPSAVIDGDGKCRASAVAPLHNARFIRITSSLNGGSSRVIDAFPGVNSGTAANMVSCPVPVRSAGALSSPTSLLHNQGRTRCVVPTTLHTQQMSMADDRGSIRMRPFSSLLQQRDVVDSIATGAGATAGGIMERIENEILTEERQIRQIRRRGEVMFLSPSLYR